ncbi:RidA family protein [Nocardioides sp. LMS-CY]|uniref:2-iminobutanoate/2-iminopropanoate deaminase n=1 Tax=Nocardioides soli TaxID=1036020 RepID=A0A7W4Z232_9ACTN|nr:RidA family protein [Nocardioides sp. LMS-CY]MBB3043472.1 2-iminobutanoate/2-iminopropanoate deaminase [Nocardioides soli]QWF20992.1 RidA family protein [Nocardioides sp. LMS-CY]
MKKLDRRYIGHAENGLGFSISAGLRQGNLVFVSGAGTIDEDGRVPEALRNDTAAQTRLTLDEIDRVLREAGGSLEDAVMFTVFLGNAADFPAMNQVWTERFKDLRPTRTTVGVELMDPDLCVEINAIAVIDPA